MAALSKRAADAFAARGRGAIVNVSSTAAFKPMAGLVLYGATKAFVKELSLGLRLELAGHGVDVCVVFPGPVRTPMIEAALGRPVAPAGRVGRLLERAWFMDAGLVLRRRWPGSAGARPRWSSTRWTGPLSAFLAGSSAASTTGRCASSPVPEAAGAVEAGAGRGVA
jgi:NAD(P)-dependent dehydrogenase (short-subunit alcohol dehydrogenase family)